MISFVSKSVSDVFASIARLARHDRSRSIHSQLGICIPRHHEGLRSAMVPGNVPGRFIAPMSNNGLRLKPKPLRPASGLSMTESTLRAAMRSRSTKIGPKRNIQLPDGHLNAANGVAYAAKRIASASEQQSPSIFHACAVCLLDSC
jgi:hypothetical protein